MKFDGLGAVYNYAGATIFRLLPRHQASGTTDDIAVYNWGTIIGRKRLGREFKRHRQGGQFGVITGSYDNAAASATATAWTSTTSAPSRTTDHPGAGLEGHEAGRDQALHQRRHRHRGGTSTNGSASVRTALISGANNGILAMTATAQHLRRAERDQLRHQPGPQRLRHSGCVNNAGYSTTITNYGITQAPPLRWPWAMATICSL